MLKELINYEPSVKIPDPIHKIFKKWELDFLKVRIKKDSSIKFQERLKIFTKCVETKKLSVTDAMKIFEYVVITMQASVHVQKLSGEDDLFKGQNKLTEEAICVGRFLSANKTALVVEL